MSDQRLQRLLTRAGEEGRAESQARAWPIVQEAFRTRPVTGPASHNRLVRALAAACAALALIAGLAFTAPGNAIADWVRDVVVGTPGAKHAKAALTHLPGGGRLLVRSSAGVWVVQADGSRRLIGPYTGATWSPHGLYVAAWRGHELFAVEPTGRVHWSLARSGTIHGARWSPEGFRIAYLTGSTLRVVAGDGTGDKLFERHVAPVVPEWRPNSPHLLAYAPGTRVVAVGSTDLNGRVWSKRLLEAVRSFAWSGDGRLLAVATSGGVTVLDGATGRYRGRVATFPGYSVRGVAFAPRGTRLALIVASARGRAAVLAADAAPRTGQPRLLFGGAGRFSSVAWSPDGRWILIAWPEADQWLFLRSARVTGVSAVRSIAKQFDPRSRAPRFPAVGGWCCR